LPRIDATSVAAEWQLADWLAYQEQLHPRAIVLDLERVREVAQRLGLLPPRAVTLTVAGTNGKGSSVTLAAGIYQAAGYRVGRYLSPHLLEYNERIAVDGVDASDQQLCAAFSAIERARSEILLTYFEFGTLAALWIFREVRCDVQVLEVGLGGRLDAVNIVDADCALITNIGIDHTDWLGPDRDSIGREKAGILRPGQPAICAERAPPQGLIAEASRLEARLQIAGTDFGFDKRSGDWSWTGGAATVTELPPPALEGEVQYVNASGVLAAVRALHDRLPVPDHAIRSALRGMRLRGRYEKRERFVLDVAHNVESAEVLADNLRADPVSGATWLVLGMLSDKPVEGVCSALASEIDGAWFASLPPPRGLGGHVLARRSAQSGLDGIACDSVEAAFRAVVARAEPGDRILICGSFLTVSAAARLIDE